MIFTTLIEPEELYPFVLNSKINKKQALTILDVCCSIEDPEVGTKLYAEGHIPGALQVNFDTAVTGSVGTLTGRHPLPEKETFRKAMESFGVRPDRQVIIYDQGGLGFATRLWYQLRWLGLENAAVLNGGRNAWIKRGYALSAAPASSAADGAIPPLPSLEEPVLMGAVQENLRTHEHLIVDARPLSRFNGIGETIDHKAGHIPDAVCRPGSENFTSDGRFKNAKVLRSEFLSLLGGRGPQKLIHSCGSGVNATANLFAMALAGLHGSRLYAGSWSQWIDDPSNPVCSG